MSRLMLPLSVLTCWLMLASASAATPYSAGGTPPPGEGGVDILRNIEFAPHRAVYEISLARANVGSSVEQLEGRMVYELEGNRCDGYTQSLRFVTRAVSKDGTTSMSDLRTASFEDGAATLLRFSFQNYFDGQLSEKTSGLASRDTVEGDVKVSLRTPKKQDKTFKPAVMFPLQHAKHVVASARRGETLLSTDFYDGSDKGLKVYATTAVIGKAHAADDTRNDLGDDALKGGPQPSLVQSWPVAMSYFPRAEDGAASDAVPDFEMAYRFHENGLTSDFVIDHGDFAFKGKLTQLEYLKQATCEIAKDRQLPRAPADAPGVQPGN